MPIFQSSPTVYRVEPGNTVRLECKVERLGPVVISWKKVNNNSSEYLVTGRTVTTGKNERVSVLTSSSSSMLLLSEVEPKDV